MKFDAETLRKMKPQTKDAVYLLFSIHLEPGQTAEVRPTEAIRIRYKSAGKYCPPETVPIDSIRPFKTYQFNPRRGDLKSFAAWEKSSVWFTAVHLGDDDRNELVGGMECPAHAVTYNNTWSTSKSASDVRFTVMNRGTEAIDFTGQIEGATPSGEA